MKKNTQNWSKRFIVILWTVGGLMVLTFPYILTRQGLETFNFKETGQIGDTIGGITAPVCSLIGSILVFLALRAQIEANKIIQKQITDQKHDEANKKNVQFFFDQFKILREELDNFYEYTASFQDTIRLTGRKAIASILKDIIADNVNRHESENLEPKGKEKELLFLVNEFYNLCIQIQDSNISLNDKSNLAELILFQVETKIFSCFDYHEKDNNALSKPCNKCGKRHLGLRSIFFINTIEIRRMLQLLIWSDVSTHSKPNF